MTQEDINRGEWVAFCESFGREHQDWLVNVEVLKQNGSKDIVGHSAALQNIAVVPSGAETPDKVLISFVKGDQDARVHEVQRPGAIRLGKNDRGAHEQLLIEADNGDTTVICLHAPSLPDEYRAMGETQ